MNDSEYDPSKDGSARATTGDYNTGDDGYAVPVIADNDKTTSGINPGHEDSDEQLARDDRDAIDESNIIDSRTRGAQPRGEYREPGDEEGLPGPDDGTSSV
ncbi:hypothetical protein H072_6819 [Dactylellina haptotyla CBS 200.50]|uniref:Histone chaperone domain-containing protein n=1 Tax=Dactylellina haptotyla (strain CBS 200.50) TaxID=1284197 RepID=S8BVT5_DACHA|nr:hypothetical protein H072_6819 [Dactylellina haptotyla CBS 200.50]